MMKNHFWFDVILILAWTLIISTDAASTTHFFDSLKGLKCDCVADCRDEDTYANIQQGFLGYNPALSDPLPIGSKGDSGYQAAIFDVFKEREGGVRFGNTAANDLNRCDGSIQADVLSSSKDFISSVTTKEGDMSGFHVGPELDISASAKGVEASKHIPPIFQSVGSRSSVMTEIAKGFASEQSVVTRTKSSCFSYSFSIEEYQHPMLKEEFKTELNVLDQCLGDLESYDLRTQTHDTCVRTFFKSYGTHYIKAATFGSKLSILTVLKKDVLSHSTQKDLEKCSTHDSQWSFLGNIGGGSQSSMCKESVFGEGSEISSLKEQQYQVTIGSRPAESFPEWAQDDKTPVVVHKTIAPISELMTKYFIDEGIARLQVDGDAKIKKIMDQYVVNYCGLNPSDCTFVSKGTFEASTDNPSLFTSSNCNPVTQTKDCALYTGPVVHEGEDEQLKFLPDGEGSLEINGEESEVNCKKGVCQVIERPGKTITEMTIKTSVSWAAECSGCSISTKVCDSLGNCCNAGSLPKSNFPRGDETTVPANQLGACENFKLKEDGDLTVTITHKSADAWKGSFIKMKLSDATYRICPIYQTVDDDQSLVLTCMAGRGPKNTIKGIMTKTSGGGGCRWHKHNRGDYCRVAAEICQMDGKNCCKTGTLNSQYWDFEDGHVDTFLLNNCGTDVDASLGLKVTYQHQGGDAWEGEWTQVLLSDGIMKYCGGTGDLDDNKSKTTYCY